VAGGANPKTGTESSTELILSIKEIMDPTMLQQWTANHSQQSLPNRIQSLALARQRLKQLADQLSNQTQALRQRARDLRQQK